GGATNATDGDAGAAPEPTEDGGDGSAPIAPFTLDDTRIPSAALGATILFELPRSGGTELARFSLKSRRLPKGVILATDGMLAGFPTTWGDFTFEVEATSGGEVVTRTYTWRITTRMWIVYTSDDREPGVAELNLVNVGAGTPYAGTNLGAVHYYDWL